MDCLSSSQTGSHCYCAYTLEADWRFAPGPKTDGCLATRCSRCCLESAGANRCPAPGSEPVHCAHNKYLPGSSRPSHSATSTGDWPKRVSSRPDCEQSCIGRFGRLNPPPRRKEWPWHRLCLHDARLPVHAVCIEFLLPFSQFCRRL